MLCPAATLGGPELNLGCPPIGRPPIKVVIAKTAAINLRHIHGIQLQIKANIGLEAEASSVESLLIIDE